MPSAARSISTPRRRPRFDATKLYAIAGFSAANYVQTALGGGEAGDAAGFGVLSLFAMTALPASSVLFNHRAPGSGTSGYYARFGTAGVLTLNVSNGTTLMSGNNLAFTPSDVGRVQLVCSLYDGAARQLAWRGTRSAGTSGAYVANNAVSHSLTGQGSTEPASAVLSFGQVTFRGMPSDAQLQAVYDATRTLGDFPSKAALEALMPGTTVTHRWSLREAIIAGKYGFESRGQVAPAALVDTVTAANVDAMARVGTPTVAVIDPSADGRKSYGALGFATGSYLESAVGASLLGAPSGFVRLLDLRFDSLPAGYRIPVSYGTSWDFRASGATFSFSTQNGGSTANYTVPTADIGRRQLVVAAFDGSALSLYVNAGLGGSGSGAFAPAPADRLLVGKAVAGLPADTMTVFGVGGWDAAGGITLSDVQALFADYARTGRIVMPSGKTNAHFHDLTQDIIANGGPQNGIPAQVLDRVGTDHLTRVGTGLQVAQRAERLWSYETTPILYGAQLDTAAHYSSAAGFAGSASGFMFEVLARFDNQTGSATRMIVAKREITGTTPGYNLFTQGTNNALTLAMGGSSGSVNAPVGTIAASDLSKLFLITSVWDQPSGKVRLYWRRAEQGTGTTLTGGYAPATTPFHLGRRQDASTGATGITIFGFRAGNFVPTIAQVQASHDEVMASETMPTASIYGANISTLYRFSAGAAPSTLSDLLGSENLAVTGTPTISAHYARSWGW